MLPGRKYTPEDVVRIAWHRKWVLIAGMVLLTTIAVAGSRQLPDLYRSETLILVIPQRVPESYVRSTVTARIEDRLRSLRQEMLSRSRLERIITEFNLYEDQRETVPMEVLVAQMRANVQVETVRDDAFTVSFVANAPRTAMIVADRLATVVIEENLRDRETLAQGTNRFLESQLEDARQRLILHENRLAEYRRRYSGELPSQLETNLQVIESTQQQIHNLTESINRDRDRRLLLEKSMAEALNAEVPASPRAAAGDDPMAIGEGRAIDQLDQARADLRALELRFKPEHPDVMAKRRVIAELERKVKQEMTAAAQGERPIEQTLTAADLIRRARARGYQAEIAQIDQQISGKEAEMERLRKAMGDYQRRVDAVPGHESELSELMRDYETLQIVYRDLLAKKENSEISADLERQQVGEQFRILDPARLPEKPFSPNRPRIALLASVLGLGLGLGLTAFLEYRDMTLRTEDEIVRTLVLPVLSAIPIMTAVADVRRHRRNVTLTIAAGLVGLIAAAVTVVWQLGLAGGPR
jgi:polysaccharide chain length determinant protein (PEP-CTERM system associated)